MLDKSSNPFGSTFHNVSWCVRNGWSKTLNYPWALGIIRDLRFGDGAV